jgi:predicted nuclease with RNAse H fold
MFLGGLTARAIEIASWFKSEWGTKVIEVYPKLVSQELLLDSKRYKKEAAYLPSAVQSLARAVEWDLSNINIDNWHQFDSLLALYATERYSNNKAQSLGNKQEGLIYF